MPRGQGTEARMLSLQQLHLAAQQSLIATVLSPSDNAGVIAGCLKSRMLLPREL